jgi:hypothetical protein
MAAGEGANPKKINRARKILLWVLLMWLATVAAVGLFVLPPYWESRRERNEAAAVETLREIYAALFQYRSMYPQTGFPDSLFRMTRKAAPPSCWNAGLLPPEISGDRFTKVGYDFYYELTRGSGSCPPKETPDLGRAFLLRATPSVAARTGRFSFYLDAEGQVRRTLGTSAGPEGMVFESLVPTLSVLDADPGISMPEEIVVLRGRGFVKPPVVFNHAKHANELLIDCETCHHPPRPERPLERTFLPCSDCHETGVRLPMRTSFQIAFHDVAASSGTCIDCHKQESAVGRSAPVECAGCHVGGIWFGNPAAVFEKQVEKLGR